MSLRSPIIKGQVYVFPELLKDKIENGPHEARFFLYLADILDLDLYRPNNMGSPRYSRITLMAVIFYAMFNGYYSAKSIKKYAQDSIGIHWILNGMKIPSYKTVERTINSLLEEIDKIFVQILKLCERMSLIGKRRMYIDGVKIQANASKHKAMSYAYLNKKIESGKSDLQVLFSALKESFDGFENLTDEEIRKIINVEADIVHNELQKNNQKLLEARQDQTFNLDLEETEQTTNEIDYESLNRKSDILKNASDENYEETMDILNNTAFINNRVDKMETYKEKLEDDWKKENGNKKIPETKQINFTDPDSCIMVTKHHGVQQCYNHLAVIDDKAHIILGTHTSNNPSDQLGLIPTIENAQEMYGCLEGFQLGADTGFFSAGNIIFTKENGIDYYVSYPQGKSQYAKDKFKYNDDTDTYTCPEGNILHVESRSKDGNLCKYSNESACTTCKYNSKCTKAKDGVRRIERDMKNDAIREKAKEKANSEEGKEILRLRKSIPEPVWGNIKIQDGLYQMHFRGIEKSSLEFKLHAVMHNIRKILKVYIKTKSYQESIHNGEQCYPHTA